MEKLIRLRKYSKERMRIQDIKIENRYTTQIFVKLYLK